MSESTPTRTAVLERKGERRAMQEGYVFLDEKCLLLAGEMLRELARYAALQREFLAAWDAALGALQRAAARHGLAGLSVYPPADLGAAQPRRTPRSLMGVRLQDAEWLAAAVPIPPSVERSREAEACREAFRDLLARAVPLAAAIGNLARLEHEYRRAVRRARAL